MTLGTRTPRDCSAPPWRLHLGTVVLVLGTACSTQEQPVEEATSAIMLSPAAVLGFESTAGWRASSGRATASPTRTQGAAAYALTAPVNYTTITSQRLAATSPGFSFLSDAGSKVAVDVLLPTQQPNPYYYGALQLFVSCPSRSVYNQYLGQVELTGSPLGVYRTLKFNLTDFVRNSLRGASYTDLTFTFALNSPANALGTYLLDNVRIKSPANTTPLGPGQSVDLVALKSYTPPSSTPGEVHFTAGVVQIPRSFHVKLGDSGTGTARLELGLGTAVTLTCTFAAADGGTSYRFSSCTKASNPGDLVAADFARLTVVQGDASAGATKIRAQLALNPLGDELGTGLLTPIPTYWGETATEINQIASAFFEEQKAAVKTEHRTINLPVPEFAKRHGTGEPVDLLDPSLPPPPNDPPFDYAGHLNQGSDWDAYWRLRGGVTPTEEPGPRHTSQFDAEASVHAVLWGGDIELVRMVSTVNTDNGVVTVDRFDQPSASASLHTFLLEGAYEVPGGGDTSVVGGLNWGGSMSRSFDAPPIGLWIFSITVGVNASASVFATGDLRVDGFHLAVTPQLTAGCHLTGGIDIGIVAGGVDVRIDLIDVSTPITGDLTWHVTTAPAVCKAGVDLNFGADLKLKSMGGSVDLVLRLGICPFCWEESWNLFSWGGLDLGPARPIFRINPTIADFSLPAALCHRDPVATIYSPAPTDTITQGIATTFFGTAIRPPYLESGGGIPPLPYQLPCSSLTWTSSDPSDLDFPTTGCNPVVQFMTGGARTITLTATGDPGESDTTAANIVVQAVAPGTPLSASISNPSPINGAVSGPITIAGGAVGGTAPITLVWTSDHSTTPLGNGTSVSVYSWPNDYTAVTLTATDSSTPPQTSSATVLITPRPSPR
jgi:hypothetical protein